MAAKKLISRAEVLGGGLGRGRTVKQANTLLNLIENRTARLAAQSHHPISLLLAESTLKERNRAFLEAIALGREPPLRPAIQDIERFAPHWAVLVPDEAGLRATVAHRLAENYQMMRQMVPALRLALGLDSEAVRQAYQDLYDRPLSTIYAPRIPLGDRLRWRWTAISDRLESLPPFWLTFALNLPGAAGLLALPIALAQVGLGAGLILLFVFGLINVLTVTALAEATARSGITHFGLGFLGQLMQEYLGHAGSALATVTLALNNFFVLIIFYIGVAGTLADATRLPAELWVAGMFGICLFFISRKSLNATIATTLIIIFINILTLLAIPLLALPHLQLSNLAAGLRFGDGLVFEAAVWQPVIGIMLSTYFSHLQIATYGPVVLRRDPSGRTWIRGSAAAILLYMIICCFWLVAINGAVLPQTLASTAGTVLAPLADRVGPIIHLLGSLLVVLSLGLLSVQIALGLYYLVMERMPAPGAASPLNRLGERGRFWLAVTPVGLVFLLAEWVAFSGFGTFTSLLGILSALVLPLLGGIFPVLLLAATRRKGDFVPGVVYRLLGRPLILGAIYLFFLAAIFIHGLFIWDNLPARLAAVIVGAAVLAVTLFMLRRGALERRAVIELRDDQTLAGQAAFNITAGGQPAAAAVQLYYASETRTVEAASGPIQAFSRLQAVSIEPGTLSAPHLKVWAHQITPEGDSQGLPAQVIIHHGAARPELDLALSGGQVVAPWSGETDRVEIRFKSSI